MSTHEQMLEELRHSPRLPEILDTLGAELEQEAVRRQQFYRDMTPEQKVEFIDGEVVMHSPARLSHLEVTKRIAKLLDTYVEIKNLGLVAVEKCLVVFPRNDYEPDVVFFSQEKAMSLDGGTMQFPVPDLIVEVLSKSTESRDRGVKFEDFQANGVEEYWIVDADEPVVEQYILKDGRYQLQMKSASGVLCSSAVASFSVDVVAFFDRKKNMEALKGFIEL